MCYCELHDKPHEQITGCLNVFGNGKIDELRLKRQFWDTMLMLFYLYVFYLPTLKHAVERYQRTTEVMFWFNKMSYRVYVPLLLRLSKMLKKSKSHYI